jgi:hypothetical protein
MSVGVYYDLQVRISTRKMDSSCPVVSALLSLLRCIVEMLYFDSAMTTRPVEIICSACGADTLLRREPKYDGLKRTGERLLCASCGHEYAGEDAVPFKQKRIVQIFSEDDKLRKVDVFRGDEKGRNCRHCKHYLVNPFTQRCGLHFKAVQATDVCEDFERLQEKEPTPSPE